MLRSRGHPPGARSLECRFLSKHIDITRARAREMGRAFVSARERGGMASDRVLSICVYIERGQWVGGGVFLLLARAHACARSVARWVRTWQWVGCWRGARASARSVGRTRANMARVRIVWPRGDSRERIPPRGASAQQQHARKVKHAMYFNNAAAASLSICIKLIYTHTHGLKSSDSTR